MQQTSALSPFFSPGGVGTSYVNTGGSVHFRGSVPCHSKRFCHPQLINHLSLSLTPSPPFPPIRTLSISHPSLCIYFSFLLSLFISLPPLINSFSPHPHPLHFSLPPHPPLPFTPSLLPLMHAHLSIPTTPPFSSPICPSSPPSFFPPLHPPLPDLPPSPLIPPSLSLTACSLLCPFPSLSLPIAHPSPPIPFYLSLPSYLPTHTSLPSLPPLLSQPFLPIQFIPLTPSPYPPTLFISPPHLLHSFPLSHSTSIYLFLLYS